MNAAVTALPRSVPQQATVGQTTALLISAAATPLLVHLLPSWDTLPLGAHLLPMFWMVFVATYLFGLKTGVLAALAGPIVSLALSGAPALGRLGTMTAELLVFVAIAAWAVRRWPRVWLIAPLSYVAAKAVITVALLVVTGTIGTPLAGLVAALAGLGILTAINFALVRVKG
jgi:hypothetical protein